MDQQTVSALERQLEDALAEALARMGQRQLPHVPSRRILHLMAKAATSVYEAAVDASAAPR